MRNVRESKTATPQNRMNLFLICVLSATGATNIFVRSILFKPLRKFAMRINPIDEDKIRLGYAVNCPMCTGMWMGMVFGIAYCFDGFTFLDLFLIFCTGCSTSLCASVIDKWLLPEPTEVHVLYS
jgi:hypothetical protein